MVRANEQASGPVFQSGFLVILDHSEVRRQAERAPWLVPRSRYRLQTRRNFEQTFSDAFSHSSVCPSVSRYVRPIRLSVGGAHVS